MIEYIHSSKLEISISDSLTILQAAINENIMRAGKILSQNAGFVGHAFEPSLRSSKNTDGTKWSVKLLPGPCMLPNGEVISYSGRTVEIPITHFGTQHIILSQETMRATKGNYAPQMAPDDTTVYVTSKTKVRSSIGGSTPALAPEELLVCRVYYPIVGSPTLTDLRTPYSVYWSVPFSIPSGYQPEATIQYSQDREDRSASYPGHASTFNTESIASRDDVVSHVSLTIPGAPEIANARIEKVKADTAVWEDIMHSPDLGSGKTACHDFAINSDVYRVSYTDAFSAALSSEWSDEMSLTTGGATLSVSVSIIDAVCRVRAQKTGGTASGCHCMIWVSDAPINTLTMPPNWIGPLPDSGEYNTGTLRSLPPTATTVYHKVSVFDARGAFLAFKGGSQDVTLLWPKMKKMIVLNLQADMVDAATSSPNYSTDMLIESSVDGFAYYYNSSDSPMMLTSIILDPAFTAEDTQGDGCLITAVTNYVTTELFTLNAPPYPAAPYEWNCGPSASIVVQPSQALVFRASAKYRIQGHLYLFGYSL